MRDRNSSLRSLMSLVLVIILIASVIGSFQASWAANPLNVSVSIDSTQKGVREEVILRGNVTQNSQPVNDALVALEVHDPRQSVPSIIYRTIRVGNPSETWVVEIGDISVLDSSYNLINVAIVNTQVFVRTTITNGQATDRAVFITFSVVDASMTPITTGEFFDVIPALGYSTSAFMAYIPKWAITGVASIFCNVYTNKPSLGGLPLTLEETGHFYISRYEKGIKNFQIPAQTPPSVNPGEYISSFKMALESYPGPYPVYAVARTTPYGSPFMQFSSVQSSGFTVPLEIYPPVASFAYYPLNPYRNMSIKFDASFSSPGGYNDTITSYEWFWGDGGHDVTTNPVFYKKYTGTESRYLVTLNVTNNRGLSSTSSQYVYIKPSNPIASFYTNPPSGFANVTMTFNATLSNPGWNVAKGQVATILWYHYNFNDGTTANTTNPITSHIFTHIGNYTVTLTIKNNAGATNSTSKIVKIQAFTLVGDITGPSGVPDGKVDVRDLALVSSCYGSYPGHPKWDSRADITGPTYLVPDLKVDIRDLSLVSSQYGKYIIP